MPSTPLRHSERERCEQTVVDVTVENSGQRGHEAVRDIPRHLEAHTTRCRHDISRVEAARTDERVGTLQHSLPEVQFRNASGAASVVGEAVSPAAHRRTDRRQQGVRTGCDLPPRSHEIGDENPPGHPVDSEVVNYHEESAGGCRRVGEILRVPVLCWCEPDETHQGARRRIQQVDGAFVGMIQQSREGPRARPLAEFHPIHQSTDIDRPDRSHLEPPACPGFVGAQNRT
ncbi:hypothetical protein MLGJGCBP_02162 [Rhodococcus sp. T7]|nr:hypothetical protein MLGJGCBP_02162 [Rhodococcus sp. T7]